ncbi:hypothetical protein [Bacteroides sedimenti]|uniref:hypothetical protein n=1 Tax=Bacteroides sedimenti TaxID=2136147 RepID=UPI00333E94EC
MKLYLRRQAVIAWILLFSIAPMGVVKSIHTHEEKGITATHHCDHSSCNCAICQFHLLPYVAPTLLQLTVYLVMHHQETTERTLRVTKVTPYSYLLRAPPSSYSK